MKVSRNTVLDQIFSIPLSSEQYLIYAPLKRTAFIANAKLVNDIFHYCNGLDSESQKLPKGNLAFLRDINFFQPEPLPIDEYKHKGIQYDSVILFLTNQCNLRCTYCYACAGEYPLKEMSWEIARAAIDHVLREVEKNKSPSLTLGFHGGGEPTLNWKILTKATDYAHSIAAKNGIPLNVSGSFNGYWPKRVRRYILKNFTDISLSFDGLPEIQNLQRPTKSQKDSFPHVIETLQALDESELRYGIRMTITNNSVQQMAESIAFIAEQFSPQQIQVEPAFEEGRAKRSKAAVKNLELFVEQFIKGYRIAEKHGIVLFYSGARPDTLTQRFCLAACRALVVTPDGGITTCFETYSRDHPLSEHFIVGRFNNGKFIINQEKLHRHFSRTVQNIPYCADCFCKWHCAGDCSIKTLIDEKTGEFHPTNRCFVNQELTKFLILVKIKKSGGLMWTESNR